MKRLSRKSSIVSLTALAPQNVWRRFSLSHRMGEGWREGSTLLRFIASLGGVFVALLALSVWFRTPLRNTPRRSTLPAGLHGDPINPPLATNPSQIPASEDKPQKKKRPK